MDLHNLLDEDDNVEKLVYNNLTESLREELFLNYRQQFFKKILIFGEIAQSNVKFLEVYEELIYKIKDIPFGSEEMIYSERDHTPNSLYFLLKGNLKLKYPFSKNYIKILENGENSNHL